MQKTMDGKELVKPRKPIEPNVKDYPRATPVNEKSPFVIAYRAYQKEMEQYVIALEIYEQTKLIRLIKNAKIDFILRKYKIIKR